MKRSIRIAFLAKHLPPFYGGMETVTQTLCAGLRQRGFHISLIGVHSGQVSQLDCCDHLIALNSPAQIFSQPLFLPSEKIRSAVRDADVVIHNFPHPLLDAYSFAESMRAKSIVIFHSEIHKRKIDFLVKPLSEMLLHKSDAIVVSSPQHLGFKSLQGFVEKTQVIPFGTPFHPMKKKEKDYILCVGRLVPYKGFEYLIDAMEAIDSKLVIVGDGPLKKTLKKRALKYSDRIGFLSAVDQNHLEHLYSNCKMLVLPSVTQQETFGLSLVEAMSYGKPVVTTDIETGVNFVNQAGETGLCCSAKDAGDLARKINSLLADHEMRHRMGKNAHRRVQEKFGIERMINKYEQLIRGLVTQDTLNELNL